jgi:hypothetical protein
VFDQKCSPSGACYKFWIMAPGAATVLLFCRILENPVYKCHNAQLQLKKSKRITVRHFYSLVPMSVVSSPKATS